MTEQTTIDLAQQAITMTLLIAAPVLIVGLAVALVVGLFQALTQIQDTTLAMVPKILAMLITIGVCLPWLLNRMVEYTQQVITTIPDNLGG
ncbi:MAG: flagellar biosynthesis protein FliQ [Pirellulaceae bacterium]|tara:strand:- start:35 stop:307 length:273 start_codon:yes stop_codon:yes gene_type:complete